MPVDMTDPAFIKRLRLVMNGVAYPMSLVAEDATIVEKVVNQGIDSYLEACFCPQRGDRFEWRSDRFALRGRRLECVVSAESLPTLLRRLYDVEDVEGEASSLADSILMTLGFDEDGCYVGREALGLE